MALTVDWTTPSSTAISSCLLPSSRSALTLAIRGSSTILDLGTVSDSLPLPFCYVDCNQTVVKRFLLY
jgi:hypothetical protein